MTEGLQVGALLIALLGAGSVIGIALKLAWDGNKHAGTTHDHAFDKGRSSRDVEVDGLRRSFEERFQEMETRLDRQSEEILRLRRAIVTFVGWVKEEHQSEALELLLELGLPHFGSNE